MIYQTFAELYDELFDPAMYQQWLDFVRRELPDQDGQLLELACGTGRLGVLLAQAGYAVTGLDLSENMLALAQEHVEAAQVNLPLLQGDMLDLSEIGTFDAVTCFADSFCYLPDSETVQRAFAQVAQHLSANGAFLFDVITPTRPTTFIRGTCTIIAMKTGPSCGPAMPVKNRTVRNTTSASLSITNRRRPLTRLASYTTNGPTSCPCMWQRSKRLALAG